MLRSQRVKTICAVGIVVTGAVATFVLCHEKSTDLDLYSGRMRYQSKIGPIVIFQRIVDTPFSRLLVEPEDAETPHWGHVHSTGAFGGHGRYGLETSELKRFMIVCEDSKVERDRQVALARELLLLFRDGHIDKGSEMIDAIAIRKPQGASDGASGAKG